MDAGGVVQHHEEFPYTVENDSFSESCSATVNPISGSNGAGFLLDTGCLPSTPLSGGPWEILGVNNGRLVPVGKPLYAQGEMGDFVPGKISKIGSATQILADELRIKLFTGYFFVWVPVRLNWLEGKLALAQHCYYQTGHGAAEGGCEMPVEGVERHPGEQELTFVRMFTESNEQVGTPDHVVIKKDSKVEILAGKVLVTWEEAKDNIGLGVGDDIWVKAAKRDGFTPTKIFRPSGFIRRASLLAFLLKAIFKVVKARRIPRLRSGAALRMFLPMQSSKMAFVVQGEGLTRVEVRTGEATS